MEYLMRELRMEKGADVRQHLKLILHYFEINRMVSTRSYPIEHLQFLNVYADLHSAGYLRLPVFSLLLEEHTSLLLVAIAVVNRIRFLRIPCCPFLS